MELWQTRRRSHLQQRKECNRNSLGRRATCDGRTTREGWRWTEGRRDWLCPQGELPHAERMLEKRWGEKSRLQWSRRGWWRWRSLGPVQVQLWFLPAFAISDPGRESGQVPMRFAAMRCDATRLDRNGLQLSEKTAYLRYWADKFPGESKGQRSEKRVMQTEE
ncbi:hypothetical protein F5883DRAFT_89577 [Diaporthe sp. PMI_573]|nr:hypothetical protein F5883DRAFT_89577 [Diaporthaceae sp. PMI_573]